MKVLQITRLDILSRARNSTVSRKMKHCLTGMGATSRNLVALLLVGMAGVMIARSRRRASPALSYVGSDVEYGYRATPLFEEKNAR